MTKKFRKDFAVFCCPHVFNKTKPVLLVIRDPEGDWQFLSGENDTDECHHVGVGHLLARDPSLEIMAELEIGSGAERESETESWDFFELE